jgi:hypothetical protein
MDFINVFAYEAAVGAGEFVILHGSDFFLDVSDVLAYLRPVEGGDVGTDHVDAIDGELVFL